MARSFFDYYYDRDEQFTAETRKEKYAAYHRELTQCSTAKTTLLYNVSTPERIRDQWRMANDSDFYLYASQVYEKVQLDAKLLVSEDDVLFQYLPPELQKLVRYHAEYHALFLLDHATIPNNRYDIKAYQDHLQKIRKTPSASAETKPSASRTQPREEQSFSFLYAVFKGIFNGILNFFKACLAFDSQQLITLLSLANAYRLLVGFYRLTWKGIWLLGRAIGWLDKADFIAGKVRINIDILETPVAVFNILSVFLFLGRFIVDLLVSLKHVFFPVEDKEDGVNYVERARMENRKRYGRAWNDLFWALANSLTNIAMYFHIPLPITGWLLAVCLTFDIYWTAYKFYYQDKDHGDKKEDLQGAFNSLSAQDQAGLQTNLRRLQLRQLECLRVEKTGAWVFNMTAAVLLPLSFVLLLSLANPVISTPICFFACAFAVAMYLTADDVGAAVRASHERRIACRAETDPRTNDAWLTLDSTKLAAYQAHRIKAEHDAWVNVGLKFAELMIMPAIIIGLFTVCWPAAVAVTLLYVGIKYRKQIQEQVGHLLTHCREGINEASQAFDEAHTPLLTAGAS